MTFTLITSKGRLMVFYVEAVANLYQSLYGGVVFTQQILTNPVDNGLTFAAEPV